MPFFALRSLYLCLDNIGCSHYCLLGTFILISDTFILISDTFTLISLLYLFGLTHSLKGWSFADGSFAGFVFSPRLSILSNYCFWQFTKELAFRFEFSPYKRLNAHDLCFLSHKQHNCSFDVGMCKSVLIFVRILRFRLALYAN